MFAMNIRRGAALTSARAQAQDITDELMQTDSTFGMHAYLDSRF